VPLAACGPARGCAVLAQESGVACRDSRRRPGPERAGRGGGHGRRPAARHSSRIRAASRSSARRSSASSRSPVSGESSASWRAARSESKRSHRGMPGCSSKSARTCRRCRGVRSAQAAPEPRCLLRPPLTVVNRKTHDLHSPLVCMQHIRVRQPGVVGSHSTSNGSQTATAPLPRTGYLSGPPTGPARLTRAGRSYARRCAER
jgi:hypothetical protein